MPSFIQSFRAELKKLRACCSLFRATDLIWETVLFCPILLSHGAKSGDCISACYVMSELWIWIIEFYEHVLIYINQGTEWEKYICMLCFVQTLICIRKLYTHALFMPYSRNYRPTQWWTEYLCIIHTEFSKVTSHSMPSPPCTYIHCDISCWISCLSSPSHLLACAARRLSVGDWLV